MNTKSESHAEVDEVAAPEGAAASPPPTILVWDAPVRVFHWLMVLCFAGAWLTAESERWRMLHLTLGYTMAGLVVFRLVWGLVGSRHARFSSFVRSPAVVLRYLRGLLRGRPEHFVGHNPAGALAIVGLLGLVMVVTVTGWATINELGGEWVAGLHEFAAQAMLALVGLHLVGVALSSWLHRENLVGAMVNGQKNGRPGDGIRSAWRAVAAGVLVAVISFWCWQWREAPTAAVATASVAPAAARFDSARAQPTAMAARSRS
jgi:cytochrome b